MTRKGFKQIIVSDEVYAELEKRKGKMSFNMYIGKLLGLENVSIQQPPLDQEVSIQPQPKQAEYRYHGCKECTATPEQAKLCRIREMKYAIYGLKCPKELS